MADGRQYVWWTSRAGSSAGASSSTGRSTTQELERIFARCWLFLCHEWQIPQPGRLLQHLHGRGPGPGGARRHGQVHAVPERLPSSGQPAVPRRCGQRRELHVRLPWLDLSQRWEAGGGAVPSRRPTTDALDREHWGLIPVAQLDSYKGLLFATFDPDAPPLREYLGEMTWYLDAFFDRREGGIEIVGGMHKWMMPCNWKFPAENFAGDAYHVHGPTSPPSSRFQRRRDGESDRHGDAVSPGNGHVLICVGPND